MKTIKITASFTYDDKLAHSSDPEAIRWFYEDVLKGKGLALHSVEIGDFIGELEVLSVEERP